MREKWNKSDNYFEMINRRKIYILRCGGKFIVLLDWHAFQLKFCLHTRYSIQNYFKDMFNISSVVVLLLLYLKEFWIEYLVCRQNWYYRETLFQHRYCLENVEIYHLTTCTITDYDILYFQQFFNRRPKILTVNKKDFFLIQEVSTSQIIILYNM